MINEGTMLASYGYFGGAVGDMLAQWEQYGFFSYLLPFLLVFAMVFGILSQIQLFKNQKSINSIIALAVGLMALQFEFVPVFFSQVFPRLAVGLIILLALLIMAGLFIDPKESWIMYTLLGIGVIIFVIVLISTAGDIGWYSGQWWVDNWPMVAGAVFIILAMVIVVSASSGSTPKPYEPFLTRSK